jgi:hypothetical protein
VFNAFLRKCHINPFIDWRAEITMPKNVFCIQKMKNLCIMRLTSKVGYLPVLSSYRRSMLSLSCAFHNNVTIRNPKPQRCSSTSQKGIGTGVKCKASKSSSNRYQL